MPKVKRYKASREGYRYGKKYEAEIVTYGKTRKATIDALDTLLDEEGALYIGVKSKKPRLNITPMQKVEMPYRVIRQDVIKSYTRVVRGKKQTVKGYTRQYRQYYVPEDEERYAEVEGWTPS